MANDLTGAVFGQLTVLGVAEVRGKNRVHKWQCKCDCGNLCDVTDSNLKTGNTRSCGCGRYAALLAHRPRLIDIVGTRYGALTVIKRIKSSTKSGGTWECLCDCGQKYYADGSALRRGNAKSCGCTFFDANVLKAEQNTEKRVRRIVLHAHRWGAKHRGIEDSLTDQEILHLMSGDCHYCGISPCRLVTLQRRKAAQSTIKVNGIDRLDSALGYAPANVVSCCYRCNYAKRDMSYGEFLAYLDRLVSFRGPKQ